MLRRMLALLLLTLAPLAGATVVVKADTATVRATPARKGKEVVTLKQFAPVTVLDTKAPDYTHVKLKSGEEGYILSKSLAKAGFVSVGDDTANVRRGPGAQYDVIMTYKKKFPLRVLDQASNGWLKIMDFEGDRGWISPKSVVAEPVYVITKGNGVNLRQEPSMTGVKLFAAEKGVIFQELEEKDGWLKVKHPDGDMGWISEAVVYGWSDVADPGAKGGAPKPVADAGDKPAPKKTAAKAAKGKGSDTEKPAKKKTAKTKASGKSSSRANSAKKSASSGKASTKKKTAPAHDDDADSSDLPAKPSDDDQSNSALPEPPKAE